MPLNNYLNNKEKPQTLVPQQPKKLGRKTKLGVMDKSKYVAKSIKISKELNNQITELITEDFTNYIRRLIENDLRINSENYKKIKEIQKSLTGKD